MIQIINRKILIIGMIFFSLPYFFRIFNIDLYIINFLLSKNSNFEQKQNLNQKKILLGYVEFYPYTYTNQENKPDGIFIQKAKKIFAELPQYEVDPISLPAPRLFDGLKTGSVQLFIGITSIPSLQGFVINSENKVGTIEMRVYSLYKILSIKKKEDLIGKKVILIRGYGYSGWADFLKKENSMFLVEAMNHEIAFEMLFRNRGDYLLEYKEPAENTIEKLNLKNLNFVSLMILDCYFIISKKYSEAVKLKELLDKNFKNK